MGKAPDALEVAELSESTQVIYTSGHGDNIGERGLWENPACSRKARACP